MEQEYKYLPTEQFILGTFIANTVWVPILLDIFD